MFEQESPDLLSSATAHASHCLEAIREGDLKNGMISLNLLCEYLQGRWNATHGVRELVQNYLDGLASLLNAIGINKPLIRHVCTTEKANTLHIVSYYYHHQDSLSNESEKENEKTESHDEKCLELGYLHIERSLATNKCRMDLVNRFTCLATNVLRLGKTDKKGTAGLHNYHQSQAGGFGEGLKVGILALLREGVQVCYFTAATKWEFKFRDVSNDRVLYVHTRKHNDAKKLFSSRDTHVVLTWSAENLNIFDRSMFPSLTGSFMNSEKRCVSVLPLNKDLHFSDVRNSFLLFGDDHAGTVYVSLIRVDQCPDFLVGVGFSCPDLHKYLGRDRNQVSRYAIGRHFGVCVADMLGRRALSDEQAHCIYKIVESLNNAKETVWDSLIEYNRGHDAQWTDIFVEHFQQCHKSDAYPCTSEIEATLVSQDLGKKPVLVSRCLYNILVLNPERSGYFPLEDEIREAFVRSPIVPIEETLLHKIDLFARAAFAEMSTGEAKPTEHFVVAHDTRSRRSVCLHLERNVANTDTDKGDKEEDCKGRLSLRLSARVLDTLYMRERKNKRRQQRQQNQQQQQDRRFPPIVQLFYGILSSMLMSGSEFVNDTLTINARLRLTERMYDLASDCFRDDLYYASMDALDLQEDDEEDGEYENDNDDDDDKSRKTKERSNKKRKRENNNAEDNSMTGSDTVGNSSDSKNDTGGGYVGWQEEEEEEERQTGTTKKKSRLANDREIDQGTELSHVFDRSAVLTNLRSVNRTDLAPSLTETADSNKTEVQVEDSQRMHKLRVPLVACATSKTDTQSIKDVFFFRLRDVHMSTDSFASMRDFAVDLRAMLNTVFDMENCAVGVFWAPDSTVCALNHNGGIFFNAALHNSQSDMFLSTCHELTHNVYRQHDWRFVSTMEQCISSFMPEYIRFAAGESSTLCS